jgi:hypothetical protein
MVPFKHPLYVTYRTTLDLSRHRLCYCMAGGVQACCSRLTSPGRSIRWAFDSVSWPFLLKMLRRVGFNMAWCDWISVLISTASTRVLLNGDCGSRICHARGLHQGDPLSPMLFLLVMEALNTLIRKADSWSLLHPLGIAGMPQRSTPMTWSFSFTWLHQTLS